MGTHKMTPQHWRTLESVASAPGPEPVARTMQAVAAALLVLLDRTDTDHAAAIAEKAREWRAALDPSVSVAAFMAAGKALIATVDAERAGREGDQ